ncbi:hypothetical protein CB1_000509010 [Camelus ferus]|nr:hypothetical protein CB1_000509010 [Camelus ferus]
MGLKERFARICESGQKRFREEGPRAVAEATQPRCTPESSKEGGIDNCSMQHPTLDLEKLWLCQQLARTSSPEHIYPFFAWADFKACCLVLVPMLA